MFRTGQRCVETGDYGNDHCCSGRQQVVAVIGGKIPQSAEAMPVADEARSAPTGGAQAPAGRTRSPRRMKDCAAVPSFAPCIDKWGAADRRQTGQARAAAGETAAGPDKPGRFWSAAGGSGDPDRRRRRFRPAGPRGMPAPRLFTVFRRTADFRAGSRGPMRAPRTDTPGTCPGLQTSRRVFAGGHRQPRSFSSQAGAVRCR